MKHPEQEIFAKHLYDAKTGDYNKYLRKKYGVFTLQDIIDLLPKAITYNGLIYEFKIQYSNLKKLWQTCYWNYGTFANSFCESESLLDAAYDLLCWCIENGYVAKQ